VKIAIKYQVKESWNPRSFMVELNRTASNVIFRYLFSVLVLTYLDEKKNRILINFTESPPDAKPN
jgi:hypothetical protein